MLNYLNLRNKSNDKLYKNKNLNKNGVPLKLKGFVAYPAKNYIVIFRPNKLFYHSMEHGLFDQNNNILEEDITYLGAHYDSEFAYNPYKTEKSSASGKYKLRIRFPTKFEVVYFSKKDAIGSVYISPKGPIVQLEDHFSFKIWGASKDFYKLRFVPLNASKRAVNPGGWTPINVLKGVGRLFLASSKEPIVFVALFYFQKQECLEESFTIP